MKPVQKLLTLAAAGLLGALFVPRMGDAQAPGRPESTLTITERTEVPGGVILEPGSYVVRVSNTQASWNVVTIQSPDLAKTFATILATPHTSHDAIPHTTFVFFNTPEGQPKALRSWFPPNDRFGQDFVYTKERGEELARLTNEKVPEQTEAMTEYEKSHPAESTATQTTTEETTASNERTTTTEVPPAPETTAQNMPSNTGSTWKTDTGTTTTTGMNDNDTSSREESTTSTNQTLPRTASPFPLLALAGASALGLGYAVRRVS